MPVGNPAALDSAGEFLRRSCTSMRRGARAASKGRLCVAQVVPASARLPGPQAGLSHPADLARHVRRTPLHGMRQGDVGHNLTEQAGEDSKPLCSHRLAGGSVQQGFPPQEVFDDFRRLGLAADKRYSLEQYAAVNLAHLGVGGIQCERSWFAKRAKPLYAARKRRVFLQ